MRQRHNLRYWFEDIKRDKRRRITKKMQFDSIDELTGIHLLSVSSCCICLVSRGEQTLVGSTSQTKQLFLWFLNRFQVKGRFH